jgi:hypothetical protein
VRSSFNCFPVKIKRCCASGIRSFSEICFLTLAMVSLASTVRTIAIPGQGLDGDRHSGERYR